VGCDDHHWDVHSRSGLAVVLAGTNLGPQPVDLRGKPRSTRSVWTHLERGESNFWRDRSGRILSGRRRRSVLTVPPENEKGFPTHEPAAVFAHGISLAHYDCVAVEDGSAAAVAHQVCVDHALV